MPEKVNRPLVLDHQVVKFETLISGEHSEDTKPGKPGKPGRPGRP